MKKTMKQMTVALLTVIIFLTGCATNNTNNTAGDAATSAPVETTKETPTIDIMTPWDPGLPISSDLPVFVEWGKRTGVKFNVNSPPRDAFKEKLNIVLTANELPDMIKFFQDINTYKEYGPQMFVALDEYLEAGKLPNLKKWLDKYPEIEIAMRHPEDGKLYAFPLVQDFDFPTSLWQVRNDILKKAGMDASEIQSIDDLKKAMLALKEQTGEYITSTRLGFDYFAERTQAYFGLNVNNGANNGVIYDEEQEKFVFTPIDYKDRYKQWLDLVHWMYEEKLLHPNFLTMKDQELFAGYASDDFPLMMEQTAMSNLNPNKDPNKDVQPIYPFPIDGKIYSQTIDPHYNIHYRSPMVINKNSKHIEDIIRAMDYAYSDEGIEFFQFGVEGETFSRDPKTPSGYKLDKTQSVWTVGADGVVPDGLKKGTDYGYGTWWLTGVITPIQRFGTAGFKEGEDEQSKVVPNRIQKLTELNALRSPDPYLNWSVDEMSQIAEITTPLKTYMSENLSKFILGQKPLDEWDAYTEGFNKLGYEKLVKMYNDKLAASK
ncbi:extracellular solute-binding protein [Paenibacillus sp. strain BS8-2]